MIRVNKVFLVEDHPLVRAGCQRVLHAIRATVPEAATGGAALRINRGEQPNIILDISLPDINGADMLDSLRADNAGAHVIILSMYGDIALARRLLRRGASGYVTKNGSPECMLRPIERVCQGDTFVSPHLASRAESSSAADDRLAELSPRDRRTIELPGDGRFLSEIWYELGQSYKTAANVTNMLRSKLRLRTYAALIKLAVERRLARQSDVSTPSPSIETIAQDPDRSLRDRLYACKE